MENSNKDTRWRQRFSNLEKAYLLLSDTAKIDKPSDAERAGLIKFFEVSFELSWKTMKDYLESEGFVPKSPREVIKTAVQSELINDGQAWMDALDDCNLTTHIYDENIIEEITEHILNVYYPSIRTLYNTLKEKLDE